MRFIITKRLLGWFFLALGVLSIVGILALDLLRRGEHSGIGPAQTLALVGCGALGIVGLTLIPLGKRAVTGDSCMAALSVPATGAGALIRRVLLGAALALMIGHLVVFVVYSLALAQFPFDYDQGEGFELNDTVLLSQGQWPYRNNEDYPFYASNYPPLYHVILAPFVWLFGPQYWYGRLAGFAATLITAGAIGYAVYRETRHRPIAALGGLAFVASNYVYHIGPLFRQHMTMVMFETLAVVTIAGITSATDQRHGRRNLIVGLLFLLAAGYTKQLAVVTAGAVFVYLFLRWPRRAIVSGVIFAAAAGAIFAWINWSTAGQWWLNIITANVNQYILSQFKGLLSQFLSLHGALLVLATVVVVYELYVEHLSIYSIWLVAAAVTGVLAGKWGAGDSYFATMIAAMCILAGIFAGRCLNRLWQLPPDMRAPIERLAARLKLRAHWLVPALGLAACALFILYGLAVVHLPLDGPIFGPLARTLNIQSNTKFANFYDSAGWTMGYATIGQIPGDADNGWKIVAAAKEASGDRPILSEEAAFSFELGKPVVTNPTQLLNLYQNGHYNPATLVQMIDDQAFGAVIFRARFYPQPVLDAVDQAYKPQQTISMNGYDYTILVPDPAWTQKKGQ